MAFNLQSSSSLVIIVFILCKILPATLQPLSRGLSFDPCKKRCKTHRPAGDSSAYSFVCDTLDDDCRKDCRFCSKSICDPRQNPVQFNCPFLGAVFGRCKLRCDYQRPEGSTHEFEFSCDDYSLFPTGWDIRSCISDCQICPSHVCITGDYFICPEIDKPLTTRPPPPPPEPTYEGSTCEWRCDKERPEDDQSNTYELSCGNVYPGNEQKKKECREDCFTCPLDVCDFQHDRDTYYCPPTNPTKSESSLDNPRKGASYILSWFVIASIALIIIGCIVGTAFYGRSGGVRYYCGTQPNPQQPIPEEDPLPNQPHFPHSNEQPVIPNDEQQEAAKIATAGKRTR